MTNWFSMHPILFKLGPFTVYSYGLLVAIGFITATFLASRQAERFGVLPDTIINLSLVVLISGIVGARIMYCLLNWRDFIFNPLEIIMVTHGGLVFYGGAIAAFFAAIAYLKSNKLPVFNIADTLSPYIALGHSIGRIGCFLNGCCFGRGGHPTQIYSSFALVFLFILLKVCLEHRRFKGEIFFLYLIFYSAGRFFMEFLRGDNPRVLHNLTFSQLVSIIILITSVSGCLILTKKAKVKSKNKWSRIR